MNRLAVAKYFETQNLNLECADHVRGAHAVLTEFGMNPPTLKTMLAWTRPR